jgi:signal transduction histidine kinase
LKLIEAEQLVSNATDVFGFCELSAQCDLQPVQVGKCLTGEALAGGFSSDVELARSLNHKPATFSVSINGDPASAAAGVTPPKCVGLIPEVKKRTPDTRPPSDLPRRLIEEREAERQRLARDLHDGVNQLIASAQIRLRSVEQMIPAATPAVREVLARCGQMLVRALDENRRIVRNLRPADLELGFARACRRFCEEVVSRSSLRIKCRIARTAARWNQEIQSNLFRIVQEAVYNTKRYGSASQVNLSLTVRNTWILLRIQDDGRGFRMTQVRTSKRRGQGAGLSGIRERAELLGGNCEIRSTPGKGTRITVRVPWRQSQQD